MVSNHQKNIATFIHLSTFSRFFIPFGNFIGPIILWVTNKEKSDFIDQNGKEIINFQMSIFIYALLIGTLSIPFFIFDVLDGIQIFNRRSFYDFHINLGKPSALLYISGSLGVLAVLCFIIELGLIVQASLKARDGKIYQYPLTIKFIK